MFGESVCIRIVKECILVFIRIRIKYRLFRLRFSLIHRIDSCVFTIRNLDPVINYLRLNYVTKKKEM